MSQLRYDLESGRFVGARLSVTTTAFLNALEEMIASGIRAADARARLMVETEWSLRSEGVELIPPAADALAEAQRILRGGGTT